MIGYLRNGLAGAGIGLLDVQHLAHGGRDVVDMYLARRGTVTDTPAEEQQGDVGVVGVPLAVGGAYGRRPSAEGVVARLGHDEDIARATVVVAHQGTLADDWRQRLLGGALEVDDELDVGQLPQTLDGGGLHLLVVQSLTADGRTVQVIAVVLLSQDDGLGVAQLLGDIGLDAVLHARVFPFAGRHLVVLHELEVMGGTVVSSQEEQIVSLTHLRIERFQQSAQVAVELQVGLVGVLATGTVFMARQWPCRW